MSCFSTKKKTWELLNLQFENYLISFNQVFVKIKMKDFRFINMKYFHQLFSLLIS